jgi:hypothetical protein
MSRLERLKEYANPRSRENWCGESSDPAYLKRWSDRAEANSKVAPRARGGKMKLPDNAGEVSLHDTASKITAGAESGVGRLQKAAKADTNTDGGSSYMRGIRRNA